MMSFDTCAQTISVPSELPFNPEGQPGAQKFRETSPPEPAGAGAGRSACGRAGDGAASRTGGANAHATATFTLTAVHRLRV